MGKVQMAKQATLEMIYQIVSAGCEKKTKAICHQAPFWTHQRLGGHLAGTSGDEMPKPKPFFT